MIGSVVGDSPCGNSLAVLAAKDVLKLCAQLDTYVFDWVVRQRMGGTNMNYFLLQEIPAIHPEIASRLHHIGMSLFLVNDAFAGAWTKNDAQPWRRLWAVSGLERLRLRAVLEAIVASLYGLDFADFREVVKECDHPVERLESKPFTRTLDPKGFWRVEKDKHPELRLAVLAQVAFADLKEKGLDAFLNQNDGEGWMLPETLRLADYNLGHDDRAQQPQPVASILGERFRPWQLSQSVEESWEECERHAELIRQILRQDKSEPVEPVPDAPTDLFGNPIPTDLFGNPVYPAKRGSR
jgi:hypothetical protein